MKRALAILCGFVFLGGTSFAATLTFEDLQVEVGTPVAISQGYGGLNWGNMWVVKQDPSWAGAGLGDALLPGACAAANGYYWYGTMCAPMGQTFTLNSAYMASCWWYPVTLEVKGYLMGKLMYTRTYDLSTTELSLVEFPSQIIDCAEFAPWATPGGAELRIAQFLMDSVTINATEGQFVPWKGKGAGQLTPILTQAGSSDAVLEEGVDTYLGKFSEVGTSDPVTGFTWITLTGANGDEIYGVITGISSNLPVVEYEVVIYNGTGRFLGITGKYVETLTIDPTTGAFTAFSAGTVSK